jgi:putative ABC transport system permease protein
MGRLALKVLLGERVRSLVAIAAVAFSVALVNLQGGLLLGLLRKAALLVDFGRADVWVGRRNMKNVELTLSIPERWVHRIRAVDGVARAEPYLLGHAAVTLPDGRWEVTTVVGSGAGSLLGNAWAMAEGSADAIRRPDGVLIDRCDREALGNCRLGDVIEVNGHRARVLGFTDGIVSFTTTPYVFTTLETARGGYLNEVVPADHCSYVLVQAELGCDLAQLCARIRRRVPEAEVYDRETYVRKTMLFWFTRTGMGIGFGLATFLGLLVGLGTLAQAQYAAVNERIKEFATLKAMGAAEWRIALFLLAQALGTTLAGALLGLMASAGAVAVIRSPRAPVHVPWWLPLSAVTLMIAVGLLASWLPYRRLQRIDPAAVLRG